MNPNAALIWLLGAALLPAQQEATTLLRLGQQAAAVVVARVESATQSSPEWREVRFSLQQELKGKAPTSLVLTETAQRCCGNALDGAAPGDRCLLFLARTGPRWHPIGGERGAMPAKPALVQHVVDLLSCSARDLPLLLARSLEQTDPRVALDAGLSLASLPQAATDAEAKARIELALRSDLDRGSVRTLPLAAALQRAAPAAAAQLLATRLLAADPQACAPALLAACSALPPQRFAEALAGHSLHDDAAALRAIAVMQRTPDPVHLPHLHRLLARPKPAVALAAAEALVAQGQPLYALAGLAPKAVLEAARLRANARTNSTRKTP